MLQAPSSALPVWRHALATPLTTLQLVLDQAQHSVPQDTQHTFISQAQDQVSYLRELLFPSPASTFSLRDCLSQTVRRLDCFHERHVTYVDQLKTDLELPGSGIEFQEALACAITNGWEAYLANEHQVVLVTCYIKGAHVLIQITDHGRGMNWLTRTAVISRGISTKPHHSGIGTTFIRQVIENKLHGRIIYSSYAGVGTTQTWIIPLPAPDTHTREQSQPNGDT